MSDDLKDLLGNEIKHVENHLKNRDTIDLNYNFLLLKTTIHDLQNTMSYFYDFIKKKNDENGYNYAFEVREMETYMEYALNLTEILSVIDLFVREFGVKDEI